MCDSLRSSDADDQDSAVSWSFELESKAGYLIRRGGKLLSTAWYEAEPGMTIPQFSILLELDRYPGLDQRTIADRVLIDSSTIADTCRRLLSHGYIKRARDPRDARRYSLRVTPTGRQALAETLSRIENVEERILGRLSDSERALFISLFRKALSYDNGATRAPQRPAGSTSTA